MRAPFVVLLLLCCITAHAGLLGTPAAIQSGGTYTAETGTNRRLVATGFVAKDTGTPTWSATFGGVPMALVYESAYVGDYKFVCFVLANASIPAGSQTLTVAASGGAVLSNFYGEIRTLDGRDQATAVEAGFSTSGAAGATSFTTASITNSTGADLMAAIRLAPADWITTRPSGWTGRTSNTTSQVAYIEDKIGAAGATSTYQWTFPGNDYIYGLVSFPAASGGASVLYQDDFESYADGFNLYGGVMNWNQLEPNSIKVVAVDHAHSGSKVVRFTVGTGNSTKQLGYEFETPVSEAIFEFWAYYPANYQNPTTGTPPSANNKFFRIWNEAVEGQYQDSYDGENKLGISTLPGSTETAADMVLEWDRRDGSDFTQVPGYGFEDFIGAGDLGQWTKIKVRAKTATAAGGDGRAYLQMWKNDVLVLDARPDTFTAGPFSMLWRWGYLFGARGTDDTAGNFTFNIDIDDMTVTVVQ
jgi:hypothetical protein